MALRTLVRLLALMLAVGFVGCGRVDDGHVGTTRQAVGGVLVPEGGSSPPWVSVEWSNLDVHQTYRFPATFDLLISSNVTDDVTVSLTLHAFGLETRQATKELGSYLVRGGSRFSLPLDLQTLPIRSIGSPSSIHVEVVMQRGREQRSNASSRLGYEYAPRLSAITLWGSTGKRFDLQHPGDPRAEQVRMNTLNAALGTPQGDVWDGRAFVPVAELPPVGGDGYQVRGSVDFWEGWPTSYPEPGTPLDGPPGPTRVCPKVLWKFLDASVGEDYYWFSGYNAAPAQYVAAVLENLDTGQPVWGGWLDINGCSPGLELPPALYAMTVASRLRKPANNGTVNVDVMTEQNFDLGTPPSNVPVLGYVRGLFSIHQGVPPSYVGTAHYLTTAASNVMTVAARMLDMQDNGLAQAYITVTTRDPSTNEPDCDDGSYLEPPISYASTNFSTKSAVVCLGRKDTLVYPDTWNKFVIGHELGHVVQGLGMGNMTTDYDNQTGEVLCRCDHVTSGSKIHCIQSQELIGAGESEGFAHFYASRLFNLQEQSDCAFGYYKELQDASYAVQTPPVSIDCKSQVKWLESYCLAANRGVEYDWLNFTYDINTAPLSSRTTLNDLWQVYLGACSPPECEKDDVLWAPLRDSAKAYYGFLDPRYVRFGQSGINFGVNH